MFRENLLIFWGIWAKAELILRFFFFFLGGGGAKAKHYREHGNFLSGICGDQYIIFREQGSTDPPGVLILRTLNLFVTDS